MGYANYVGRIGALAVALGIGTAVVPPGIAWAEETNSSADANIGSPSGSEPPNSEPPSGSESHKTGTPSGSESRNTGAPSGSESHKTGTPSGSKSATTRTRSKWKSKSANSPKPSESEAANNPQPSDGPPTTTTGNGSTPGATVGSTGGTATAGEHELATTGLGESVETTGNGSAPGITVGGTGGALTSEEHELPTTGVQESVETTGEPSPPAPPADQVQPTIQPSGNSGQNKSGGQPSTPSGNPGQTQPNDNSGSLQQIQSTDPNAGDPGTTAEVDHPGATARLTRIDEDTTPLVANFSAYSATPTASVVQPAVAPEPPDLISSVLAVPATLFARTVNLVVSLFEPIIGPGAPLENTLLWGVLAWTRQQVTRTLTNRSPEIGVDEISLVVDEDSTENLVAILPTTDADADAISYSVAPGHAPANGSVAISGNTVAYTPNPDFTGEDSFTLVASDGAAFHIHALGQGHTDTATVTVTVVGIGSPNLAPVATADGTTVAEGASAVVNVLGNDTDADGALVVSTVAISTAPAHGTATANSDGTITYSSNGAEVSADSFTYTVKDDSGATSNTATVTVTITPVDDAPVAVADTAVTTAGTPVTIAVLANDTDVDAGPKSVTSITQPANGTVTITGGGTGVQYTPAAGFTGTNAFNYTLNGGSTANVTVTVTAVPNVAPPVANPNPGDPNLVNGEVTGHINGSDPDGGAVTYALVGSAPGTAAELQLNATTGAFSYTPTQRARLRATNPAFDSETFTVRVTDNENMYTDVNVTVDIDPAEIGVVKTINVGGLPVSVAFSPNGAVAYVTNGGIIIGTNSVSVINTSNDTVSATTIPVGNNPDGVAFSPTANIAYVVNASSGTVSVINTTTNTVLPTTITVGTNPREVAFSPDGSTAYVTNSPAAGTGTVSVIRTSDHTVIDTFDVPSGPHGLVVSKDGSKLYVVNSSGAGSGVVTVYRTDSHSEITSIGVGTR